MYNFFFLLLLFLFTAKAWGKNVADAIEYGGEIWINQGHLQEKLDIANISDRIILMNLKK